MGVVLLVRHGQASFGADDYDVLSEAGWAQAQRLGTWLREQDLTPTALVRGGLRRHRETTEAMVDTAGWAGLETRIDPGWDEFDHLGLMSTVPPLPPGHSRREFQAAFEQATAGWARGVEGDFPETYVAFVARVRASLQRASEDAGPGGVVVVVSSGGPIAVACASLVVPDADQETLAATWARFNTVTVNSSVTRMVVGATGARLLTFNEHAHLDAGSLTYR